MILDVYNSRVYKSLNYVKIKFVLIFFYFLEWDDRFI